MTATLRRRLAALESRIGTGHTRCPDCPPFRVVTYRQENFDAEPVLHPGQEPPGNCPHCGRPCDVICIAEVIVSNREQAQRLGPEGGKKDA
jgi:hypothetical protein